MPYDNNYGGRPNNYGGQRNSAPRTTTYAPKQSTTGIRLENTRVGRFLDVNYWGKNTTLVIGAVAPGVPMDWQNTRNAQITQVNVTFSDLNEIWDICEEVIESVKNTGTFTSSGCRCGAKQDCIVEISNGSNLNLGPGIYLVLYKNLDSSNRTNQLEYFQFNSTRVIRSYDHNTGTGKEDPGKIGEFKKFYRTIKEACKAFTMAQAHTIAHTNYNDKISAFKAMAAMTASLGIDMQKELDTIIKGTSGRSSGGSSGGGYRQGGNNNNYSNRQNGQYSGPRSSAFETSGNANYASNQMPMVTTTVDDPVDISLPMSDLSNVDMTDFT